MRSGPAIQASLEAYRFKISSDQTVTERTLLKHNLQAVQVCSGRCLKHGSKYMLARCISTADAEVFISGKL